MSASGLTSDTDVAVTKRLDRRWSVPRSLQLPLPATAAVVYLGVRVLGLLFAAFLLRHGAYRQAHGSLELWTTEGDGSFYRAIAAH